VARTLRRRHEPRLDVVAHAHPDATNQLMTSICATAAPLCQRLDWFGERQRGLCLLHIRLDLRDGGLVGRLLDDKQQVTLFNVLPFVKKPLLQRTVDPGAQIDFVLCLHPPGERHRWRDLVLRYRNNGYCRWRQFRLGLLLGAIASMTRPLTSMGLPIWHGPKSLLKHTEDLGVGKLRDSDIGFTMRQRLQPIREPRTAYHSRRTRGLPGTDRPPRHVRDDGDYGG
jgi:hypothetical protein